MSRMAQIPAKKLDAQMSPVHFGIQRRLIGGQQTNGGEQGEEYGNEGKILQRPTAGPSVDNAAMPPAAKAVLDWPGRPLDADTRSLMEPRFGRDFSNVRVHTDEAAMSSARAIGAQAYTVHNHIAFAANQFQPGTERGARLLAHELTHVVQQGPAPAGRPGTDRGVEFTPPSHPTERVAEKVAAGQVDPRQAGVIASSRTPAGGAQLIQRAPDQQVMAQPKGAVAPLTKAPPERQISASEAWLFAENRIVTELQTRFSELVTYGAYLTRDQMKEFFDPYDDDLKATQTFSSILGIAAGGAGNVPNDPAAIQPLPEEASPKTPHGPIPATASVSGGIAGAVAQGITPLVASILDTSKVDDVKKKLQSDVDKFVAKDLTTSSPTYASFEDVAQSEMKQYFLSNWADTARPHDATGLDALINETARHTRASYGLESSVGKQVTDVIHDYVGTQTKALQPVMDDLERSHRRKRYLGFGLGAGLAGGLIGGAIGFAHGGAGGLLLGAGIGLAAGGVVGAGAAFFTNLFTDTAEDKRNKKAADEKKQKDKAEDEKKNRNYILEPEFRPGSGKVGTA